MNNYRLLSLLSVAGMVLERVVAKQIEEYFETINLQGTFQFGFKKNKSSISELLTLFDSLLEKKEKKNTFNSVRHIFLIHFLFLVFSIQICRYFFLLCMLNVNKAMTARANNSLHQWENSSNSCSYIFHSDPVCIFFSSCWNYTDFLNFYRSFKCQEVTKLSTSR